MYVVILGGGKVGEYLANVLLNGGNEVAIIEKDVRVADRLSMLLEGRYLIIRGDGCDSKIMLDAGINKADVFVAATGQDDNNLVSCELAQRVHNVPRSIARVNSPQNQRIFRKLGIECVSSTQLIANLIEEETLLGTVSLVSSLNQGNVRLSEISVPKRRNMADKAMRDGFLVSDIEMPEGSIIAAVNSGGDVEVVGEESVVYPGDTLIILADVDVLGDVVELVKSL